jgi:hypothetical protein
MLQNAADALCNYMYAAIMWTIATILVLYSEHGFFEFCTVNTDFLSFVQ